MASSVHPNAALLESATRGFDHLFSNDIIAAKDHFTGKDDPFHVLGLGVCSFLEAALGMETGLMQEATRLLTISEAGARRQIKAPKSRSNQRFSPGLEWEILNADAVVLLGLTNALSESYMGYLQCMYSLNSAHSKFTKLYKTVFPHGLDAYMAASSSPTSSVQQGPSIAAPGNRLSVEKAVRTSVSTSNIYVAASTSGDSASTHSVQTTVSQVSTTTRSFFGNPTTPSTPSFAPIAPAGSQTTGANTPTKSFFSRWTSGANPSATSLPQTSMDGTVAAMKKLQVGGNDQDEGSMEEDGPVEELIVAGTAFGFGLFNLVFSLLPKGIQSVVGFFGFKHDRGLALKALALSASKKDVHSVYAGLVLMTYHGVVLLLSGYQADEAQILKQYKSIVDSISSRYPDGALWILNRAKILRMSGDADNAIRVLREGLKPERPHSFAQADTLLIFELAWTLLGETRYQEAADMFLKITELNSWSHGTYYFLAAGCYFSLGKLEKAQELFDKIPDLIDKKKIGGKDLPTEVLIKKKIHFYKDKQNRRGGDPAFFVQSIRISPSEELGIFWNTHARVHKVIAEAHIEGLGKLTPPPTGRSKLTTPKTRASSAPAPPESSAIPDLDTADELALRSLLLGICHRTAGDFGASRESLRDAHARQPAIKVSTWIGGVAMFEWAVLDLKIVEAKEQKSESGGGIAAAALLVKDWERALTGAGEKLDLALALATSSTDLSSRLDSRIMMLKDEIAIKKEKLGIL